MEKRAVRKRSIAGRGTSRICSTALNVTLAAAIGPKVERTRQGTGFWRSLDIQPFFLVRGSILLELFYNFRYFYIFIDSPHNLHLAWRQPWWSVHNVLLLLDSNAMSWLLKVFGLSSLTFEGIAQLVFTKWSIMHSGRVFSLFCLCGASKIGSQTWLVRF